MPDTSEKKFQQGVYEDPVVSNATVWVDPELRDEKNRILPVHQVTVSPGFTVLRTPTDVNDPNFGMFACQNKTTATQTLTWSARYNPPVVGQVIQDGLGDRGGPGPAGIDWVTPPMESFELDIVGPLADRNGAGVNNLSTAEVDNTLVEIDDSGSAQAVNFPTAGAALEGRQTHIKRTGTEGVELNAPGGQTIEGATSFTIRRQGDAPAFVFDGTSNWVQLGIQARTGPQIVALAPLNGDELCAYARGSDAEADATGNLANLTDAGNYVARWVGGANSQALGFRGSPYTLTAPQSVSLLLTGEMTFDFVAFLDNGQNALSGMGNFLVGMVNGGFETEPDNCLWGVYIGDGQLFVFHEFGAGTNQIYPVPVLPTPFIPVQITVVRRFDGGGPNVLYDVYFNGMFIATSPSLTAPTGGSAAFLNILNDAPQMGTVVHDVRVWDSVKSADFIAELAIVRGLMPA